MPATTPNLALRKPLSQEAPDGPGQIGNLADDIEDRFGRTAADIGSLAAGTRIGQRALVAPTGFAVEARWNGSAWKPWDSDWNSNIGGGWEGLSAGYTNRARYRYRGGSVRLEFVLIMNGSSASTGTVGYTLPVAADQANDASLGRYQDGYATTGRAWRNIAANGRFLDVAILMSAGSSPGKLNFGTVNSGQYMDGLSLASGDTFKGVIEYDAA